MKIPGPDHPITIRPADGRWRASYENHVIADSADALVLDEAGYPPVIYFPREDVSMEYFARTDRSTHCPYKGDAAYYTILMEGKLAENAVWTYEQPYEAVEAIRDRLAFYPDRVQVYALEDSPSEAEARRSEVDEAILHTDAGDGTSQREHWPANVDSPAVPGEGGVS